MMMIGRIYPQDEVAGGERFLVGEIYTYYNLDSSAPWFNIARNEEALDVEVEGISIPESLKPHLSKFIFVFAPDCHRMCVQLRSGARTLSMIILAKAFRSLFAFEELAEYGPVEVTPEPSRETVDEILGMPFLHKLHIGLLRPNADDDHDFELIFQERLEAQSAIKMSQDLISEKITVSVQMMRQDALLVLLRQMAMLRGTAKILITGVLEFRHVTLR